MAVKAYNLVLDYGNEPIVKGVSIEIPPGSLCSVIGPNGCGKSTLLKALSRNLTPRSGSVEIMGKNIKAYPTKTLSRHLAFLAQSPSVPEQFTVKELISYGRFPHTGWFGSLKKKDRLIVEKAMEDMEISDYGEREINQLSGGERQRVWMAMALAQEAEILLLDEPTTYLDINHQFQTLELISRLNKEMGRTVLMVLHDLNQAVRYSDFLFVMKEGVLADWGTPKEIMTKKMLRNVFSLDARVIRDEENDCPYFIPMRGLSLLNLESKGEKDELH